MHLQSSVAVILRLAKAVTEKSDKRKEFAKFLKIKLHFWFSFQLFQHCFLDLVVLVYRIVHLWVFAFLFETSI